MLKSIYNELDKLDKTNIKKYLFIFSILYFVFNSIIRLCCHNIYFDETNAWNIAANLDIFEIFKLMKYEGHLFLWYVILMPFAKNNLFYPYSMQIINWLFVFSSILIMWRYAPFNSYVKAFITLSLPFLKIYPLLARCYSLGILLLFIIASIYPKRLKHPLIYTLLIVLVANTSIMALAGATALGLMFVYDLFKYKKEENISNRVLAIILSCFSLCAVLVLYQLVDFQVPFYAVNNEGVSYKAHFMQFYFPENYDIFHVSFAMLYSFLLISGVKFFKNDLKPFFFIFLTHSILIYIFAEVYAAECWHFCFLFIYLIMAVWIYLSENKLKTNFQIVYVSLFTIFCFMLTIFPSDYTKFVGRSNDLKNYMINNIDTFSNAKIFFYPSFSFAKEIIPYLSKYNLKFYDSYGNSINSFDAFKIQYRDDGIDFKHIKSMLSNNETAYIITDIWSNDKFLKLTRNKGNFSILFINLYKSIWPANIYIIKNIKRRL